jgi:hypothetical protein
MVRDADHNSFLLVGLNESNAKLRGFIFSHCGAHWLEVFLAILLPQQVMDDWSLRKPHLYALLYVLLLRIWCCSSKKTGGSNPVPLNMLGQVLVTSQESVGRWVT